MWLAFPKIAIAVLCCAAISQGKKPGGGRRGAAASAPILPPTDKNTELATNALRQANDDALKMSAHTNELAGDLHELEDAAMASMVGAHTQGDEQLDVPKLAKNIRTDLQAISADVAEDKHKDWDALRDAKLAVTVARSTGNEKIERAAEADLEEQNSAKDKITDATHKVRKIYHEVTENWKQLAGQPKSGRDVALPDLSPKALDYLKEIDELSDAFAKLANSESAVGTNGEAAIELGTNAP